MINHLKTKNHEDALKLFESENTEMTPKLTSVWAQKNAEADLQNKLDEQLVRIMVRQNVSTCFFDDKDLQELVKLAFPGLKIYSRLHFTRSVIPRMAGEIRTNIVKQIGSNNFSITSDGWMKPSKFPALLSVTTHTISDDFQRMDNVIATIEILSEHTGEEIARLIENFLVENGLSIGSIVACVRDDARNMQKSCRLLGIDSFQCSAHMYHLSVRDALRCNSRITNLIAKLSQEQSTASAKALPECGCPNDFRKFGRKFAKKDSVSTTTVAGASTAEFDDQEFAEVGIDPLDEDSMDIDLWARDVRSPSALSQKSTDSQRELKSAYKAEFNLFRHGIIRLGRDENVFEWWSNNKFRFPLIAVGAKRFLSVPATSVSSERTFSMAGLLYANTLRNRLGAKMAENLMLIKASLKKTMLAPSVEPVDDELDNKEEIEENVLLQQQID
uniref:HAT C-terminal dimerisation domain-containing protein n=1 Tax=Globodera rostochiensis TaxID=31243 RepID=A0A914GPT8_GLORO